MRTDDEFGDAVAALSAAWDRAYQIAADGSDLDVGFARATALARALDAFLAQIGTLRTQQARSIREANALSLSQLADRISLSKGRAQKLVERGEQP
jgi:DNA-binding transcriptional regulator YiaG